MTELRWGLADLAALLVIVALAGGLRSWYVAACADGGMGIPVLEVQGQLPRPNPQAEVIKRGRNQPTELDTLVANLEKYPSFASLAPLADQEETTAHIAPGYPWLFSLVANLMARGNASTGAVDATMRWLQVGLGTLTAACYFFFARRAFHSLLVGFLAGLLTALHPFWIVNAAELGDGALSTFLLALCLMIGTRASHAGGAFSSLLYGLALAGLAMTRAALLPFAVVALLWFLLRCRLLVGGWFCGLLALLGFGNGLAPWAVRNYREFGEPVPIVDSALLHLWIGNNPKATGGDLDERALRDSLPERLPALLDEPNQARRYNTLAEDVLGEVVRDPGAIVDRRLWAGLKFLFGENWFKTNKLAQANSDNEAAPNWARAVGEDALRGSLLVMLVLGLLGWRFSFGWRKQARLATLAAIWLPLPYLLAHAAFLSGPRLPLDGVLLCFAAFALACCVPGVRRQPDRPGAPPARPAAPASWKASPPPAPPR